MTLSLTLFLTGVLLTGVLPVVIARFSHVKIL
jgi:hypothetical protein